MSEVNYWLIPMDYKTCDYKQLKKEWDEHEHNKRIMWQAPGKPNSLDVGEKKRKGIKRGDVVYFYVTNLPSESKSGLSRIMLRGVVDDIPKPMKYREVYKTDASNTSLIYGFPIGSLTTLKKGLLEDNRYLSYEYCLSQMDGFIHPQGMTRWPNKAHGNLADELINRLEDDFKDSNMDFEALINHFKKQCFFKGKISGNHKTFLGRNGLDYYEYHHFIPQAETKRYKEKGIEIENYVSNPSNGLCLCSNCHNRIHYGTKQDVNKMIKIALEDKRISELLDAGFRKAVSIGEQDEELTDWFRRVYNVL